MFHQPIFVRYVRSTVAPPSVCAMMAHPSSPWQLMYVYDSARIATPTTAGSGSDCLGGQPGRGVSSPSNRRRQQHRLPPPSPHLMQTGPLRLLEAARLLLERLGEAEEAMNLAESALALMFGWVRVKVRVTVATVRLQ